MLTSMFGAAPTLQAGVGHGIIQGTVRDAGTLDVEVEARFARRFQSQRHIFRNGQLRYKHEVLVNHADAGADGFAGDRPV